MKIVNESNLGTIKSVFNDTAANAHYYKIIDRTFHGIITSIEFAKPVVQVNTGVIVWQSSTEGPYHSYTTLDSVNKLYIDSLIKDSLNEMKLILGEENNNSFLEDIIEIPNENSIYYTKDVNDKTTIILTEWGFLKDEHIKKEGVLKKIFSTSMKSFIVKFKSNKNEVLEGIKARIKSEDRDVYYVSDSNGVVRLNNLLKGNSIIISSLDGSFEDVEIKIDALEEYTITVNRIHTLKFKVIDSNNRPVSNDEFIFKSNIFKSKKFQTDLEGSYSMLHPEDNGSFEVFSSENNELLSEILPNEDHSYTIIYDPPVKEPINLENVNKDDSAVEKIVELEFLNWRRKPIKNKSLDIYGQNGKTSYVTDELGLIYLDSLKKDIEYGVFMNFKNTSWKSDFKHSDKIRYTFIVKKKRILWWWIPFFLFFLCLLLIPTKVSHHYMVLDKKTRQPIELANISSSPATTYKIQSNNDNTDSLGKLSIDYGKSSLYEQIFKKKRTDIFVQKSGYESLNAQVPLNFFSTNKSIIYLNKFSPRIDPIVDCNSGGDAHNAGGNSIREFDLRKESGKFVFTYNTGDTHADKINIYDCPISEVKNTRPIWSVNEATGTDKSLSIEFSSQIITVEVIGGGNIYSIWRYHVDCP